MANAEIHAGRLADKVAVITGAGSGIGRATARLFAQSSATVVAVDIDLGAAQETVREIQDLRGNALAVAADVARSDDVRRLARQCEERFHKVDVLFNNAGRIIQQSFEETTEEVWAEMVNINLKGPFLCAKYLLPLMKLSQRASIINHASVDAILGNPHVSAYSAAKGGLIPLTHTMAHDLGKYGIRVNCISSGGIPTKLSAPFVQTLQEIIGLTPLQRHGRPEEVAYLALFLASDESSFVNGTNIVIDGGRTGLTQGTL